MFFFFKLTFFSSSLLPSTSPPGLNVSATHSIIAGIMGFSLVWGGPKAVNWASPAPGQIPPFAGVVPIVVSWFASPIVTGFISAMLFLLLRTLVLRRKNALIKSLFVLPFAVALTLFINIYFVFTKGAKKMLVSSAKDWSDAKAGWISAVIAGIAGVLTALIVVPILHRRIKTFFDADGNAIEGRETNRGNVNAKGKDNDLEGKGGALSFEGDSVGAPTNAADVLERISQMPGSALELAWHKRAWKKVVDLSTTGVKYDIHEHGVKEDPMVAAIHTIIIVIACFFFRAAAGRNRRRRRRVCRLALYCAFRPLPPLLARPFAVLRKKKQIEKNVKKKLERTRSFCRRPFSFPF